MIFCNSPQASEGYKHIPIISNSRPIWHAIANQRQCNFSAWNFGFFSKSGMQLFKILSFDCILLCCSAIYLLRIVFLYIRHAKWFIYSCLGLLVHCLGLERHCLGLGLGPLGTYCLAPITALMSPDHSQENLSVLIELKYTVNTLQVVQTQNAKLRKNRRNNLSK